MEKKNFFEYWHGDGEHVLCTVNNFDSERDFIKQAEEYLRKTRGSVIPVQNPYVVEIVSNEDDWGIFGETDIKGERWKAYCSDLESERWKAYCSGDNKNMAGKN